MSAISLRLLDSLHAKVREVARREGVSINQFISTAVAEKLSALLAEEYLTERAARGSRAAYEAVLAKVRDRPPLPGDELVRDASADPALDAHARLREAHRRVAADILPLVSGETVPEGGRDLANRLRRACDLAGILADMDPVGEAGSAEILARALEALCDVRGEPGGEVRSGSPDDSFSRALTALAGLLLRCGRELHLESVPAYRETRALVERLGGGS